MVMGVGQQQFGISVVGGKDLLGSWRSRSVRIRMREGCQLNSGCKPLCMNLKRKRKSSSSMEDTTFSTTHHIHLTHTSLFRNQLRFLTTSLKHTLAPSTIILSPAAAASSFPEASFRLNPRGLCFYTLTAAAALFFFVIMLLSHPFVLLFDRYRRTPHYLIAKIWATFTITPFFNVRIQGLEHLPTPDSPAVYVSNHQSFLDIYTLLTLGRTFKFISKTSIFLYPIIGWAMYLMGVIPLKRIDTRSQLDCLKRCIDLIRRGASVFFFPEGTRSKDGKLGAFKKGAFSLAAKTQVPVVPMTIIGTGSIMPAGQEGMLNPGSVKVVIHPCLIGNDAQVLCNQARSVIANTLEQQG